MGSDDLLWELPVPKGACVDLFKLFSLNYICVFGNDALCVATYAHRFRLCVIMLKLLRLNCICIF